MSQLTVTNNKYGVQTLNVLQFNSPVYGSVDSVQTRTMLQHFPIRMTQPEIAFTCKWESEAAFQAFQTFIRNVHLDALVSSSPGVTLDWPERDIVNWTGLPRSIPGGGMRFNPTPTAVFVVDLITSLVSSRTDFSSIASNWQAVSSLGLPNGTIQPFIPNTLGGLLP